MKENYVGVGIFDVEICNANYVCGGTEMAKTKKTLKLVKRASAKKAAVKKTAKKAATKQSKSSKVKEKLAPKKATKAKKPLAVKKTTKSVSVPAKRTSKKVLVKSVKATKPVADKATKTKVAKTPSKLDDGQILAKLKEIFPALSRKRLLENVELDKKQVRKLTNKFPKFLARVPVQIKKNLGIEDDSVKQFDAEQKQARTRKVDESKAKDTSAILSAFEEAKAARGEVQTSKVIKAMQLRLNRRVVGIYVNYLRMQKQLNNFTAAALADTAKSFDTTDPAQASRIRSAVSEVASIFRVEEQNDYDYFESAGSKFDTDAVTAFDPEGDYVDEGTDAAQYPAMLHAQSPATARTATAAGENEDGDTSSTDVPEYDDNDSMFNDSDSSSDSATDKSIQRKRVKVNTIKTLGQTRIRFADRSYITTKVPETRSLFGGSKRAVFTGFTMGTIDLRGSFSTATTEYDNFGNPLKDSSANSPNAGATSLDFTNATILNTFMGNLGRMMGMASSTIGLAHVLSKPGINFLKIHGFSHNYRVLIRKNSDNTGRYGVILCFRKEADGTSRVLTILFGIAGLAQEEMVTLCQGEFTEANDQLFEYVGHSIITNGLLSQGKVFGFSVKEKSMLTPQRKGAKQDRIIKLANGKIHFVPDTDRRQEFASYKESLRLPERLDDDLTDESGKTEMDRFAGSIVYTDIDNNIVFWYSKSGKLCTTIFSGACELNARDKANIMKPTPALLGHETAEFDPTNAEHRQIMSPYGAEALLPVRYLGPTLTSKLDSGRYDGFPGIVGGSRPYIHITVEDLRKSYHGDREYWNAVDYAMDNFLHATDSKLDRDQQSMYGNSYTLVDPGAGGLTDCDWETGMHADRGEQRGKYLTGRDVSAIKIMLHIASKTKEEWPEVGVWHERAEDARVKPPAKTDLDDVVGAYNGLVPYNEDENVTAMPHQAYNLHTMHHQETAALDCDMGGGKTFMSVMDATRWISTGVHGKPARPCVVMPASLIQNYMIDVKKNFLGNNINFFVLSSSTRSWAKMDNTKIIDLAKSAPANTIFITSYEWLGLDAYPVITGTKYVTKARGRGRDRVVQTLEVPRIEKVFPNPQALLDMGINVIYLDESQKIKNKSSGFHKAVQVLSGIPIKRIMTGTMVSRDVDDVFTQTSFIDGTMIGTRARFSGMYCEEGSDTEIRKGMEKQVRILLLASGVMQLRRSMWIGLLPKKEEHFEFVDLDDLHGAVYDVLMQDILRENKDLVDVADAYYLKNKSSGLLAEAKNFLGALLYGADSDLDDTETTKDLERMRNAAVGDEDEDDGDDVTAGRSKDNKLQKYMELKRSIATKVSMLQAFISSPQSLKPKVFSEEAQRRLKALNVELPNHTAKDVRIEELIAKHWSGIGGSYKKMSKQMEGKTEGVDNDKLRGKIIIFALNIATVEHVHAYLKKTKYADQVVRYLKSDAGSNDVLLDFKDPENESASIIVAAETSVIYGQNMQSADMMIKLTIPWTTGDYDQAVARIFRNGQKLKCKVYNICANGTFEITKLAKFLIRENSNRKLISEYSNEFNMNHALGSISKGSAASMLKTGADLANFKYEDKETGAEVSLDLLDLHDSIYRHELKEAETHAKTFKDAGYGDIASSRIEISSGNQVIAPEDEDLLPVSPDGKKCGPGSFQIADMAYFDGDNIVRAREVNKKSMTAEIKRARNLELAKELGVDVVDALNRKGANILLSQYMARATDEVLAKVPDFKKFIPSGTKEGSDSTRGFLLFMGQALRDADMRLLFATNLSQNNFAEKAGNDLSDPETRAELMVFARMVYNKVIANYPGCVAIDDSVDVRKNKAGKAVEVVGYDEKVDRSVIKKNASIISKVIGNDDNLKRDEKTPTQKHREQAQQVQEREEVQNKRKTVNVEEDEDQDQVTEEGVVLGVSEMVYYDTDEDGEVNATSNDSVYVFAPITGNDPKQLRKLMKVNLGVGRGRKMFEKKTMWVYKRPVTSINDVVRVAEALEKVGGYVEQTKKGKYAIATDAAAQALFRLKAPSNFGHPENMGGGFTEQLQAQASEQAQAATKRSEVVLGLYMFDRRILLVGDCKNTQVLVQAGFRQLQLLRIDFDHNSKIQVQLETCFKRIRKAGISILNSEIIARRLRVLIRKKIEV